MRRSAAGRSRTPSTGPTASCPKHGQVGTGAAGAVRRLPTAASERRGPAKALTPKEKASLIAQLEQEMKEASRRLEFEYAAILRDQIIELRGASETG